MINKQLSRQRGFTLVELVVVIAVMGILMGLVFRGFTTIQANARDTRRIADLRTVQTQLELYFARCGHYPNTNACGSTTLVAQGSLTWSELITQLTLVVREGEVPRDPVAGREYVYHFGANGLAYVVAASTERMGNNRDLVGAGAETLNVNCDNLFCVRS